MNSRQLAHNRKWSILVWLVSRLFSTNSHLNFNLDVNHMRQWAIAPQWTKFKYQIYRWNIAICYGFRSTERKCQRETSGYILIFPKRWFNKLVFYFTCRILWLVWIGFNPNTQRQYCEIRLNCRNLTHLAIHCIKTDVIENIRDVYGIPIWFTSSNNLSYWKHIFLPFTWAKAFSAEMVQVTKQVTNTNKPSSLFFHRDQAKQNENNEEEDEGAKSNHTMLKKSESKSKRMKNFPVALFEFIANNNQSHTAVWKDKNEDKKKFLSSFRGFMEEVSVWTSRYIVHGTRYTCGSYKIYI